MSFDEFKKSMDQAHKDRVANFGIPDKLILQEDVEFWRFRGVVIPHVWRTESFRWLETTPFMDSFGTKVIGACTLYPRGDHIWASVTLPKSVPERLDFDNGAPLYLVPRLEFEPNLTFIKSIEFGDDTLALSPIETEDFFSDF